MKKLLSIILACAMIMSLFCVVPASATADATNQKLPYAFEDFEGADGTGSAGLVATNSTYAEVSVVEDATRGGHVLRGESANDVQGGVTLLSYAYKTSETDTKESFCETFGVGESISISAYAKLGTTHTSAALRFIIFYTDGSYDLLDANVKNPLNTTTWQKVSTAYTYAAEKTIETIEMRFYATSSDSHNVVMYVDDLEIKKDNRQPTLKGSVYSHNGTVLSGGPGWFQNQMAAGGDGTTSVTMTGHDGVDNVVSKIQYATTAPTTNQMYSGWGGQSYSLAAGDKIEVELWVKLDEATAHDKIYYAFSIGVDTIWTIEFNGKSTDWQHLHRIVDITGDVYETIYRNFTTQHESAGWNACMYNSNPKTSEGTYPVMYIDDFKMQAYTPILEGTDQAPATENYITMYDGTQGVRAVGANAYHWNSHVKSQDTAYETTKHDGSTGAVYRLALNAADADLQQYFLNGTGSNTKTLAAGEQVKMSQWIKLETPATADTIYYTLAFLSNVTGAAVTYNVPINGKSTDWQYVEATHTVGETIEICNMYHSYTVANTGAFGDVYNANRPKDANGNVPVFQIDDYKLQFFTPGEIITGVITIPVAEDAVASRNAAGAISATYTFKTNAGADIAAEADKSFFKLVGASGRVYASSATLAGLVYPDAASEEIKLQIIPATADYVGDTVEVDIIDLSAFNGIEILSADIGYAEISTDTAIENAKLIWVGYTDDTEHGCIEMTGAASIDVSMAAYATQEFTDVEMDLGDFTFFKVFLWADMSTTCAPLANYFEPNS